MNAFPKIFTIGQDYIGRIFNDPVEVTEKIDGSQFAFGRVNGEVFMRSKGKQMYLSSHERMFGEAVDYVQTIAHHLPEGVIFYCEYLRQPKHNTLAYNRIPRNHLMLFAVMKFPDMVFVQKHHRLEEWSYQLGIEPVPCLYYGTIDTPERLKELMDKESALGGPKMEGVVVKNYLQPFLLGGQPIPVMAGKYVSENFKEVHRKSWSSEHTAQGKWQSFKEGYRTEARWMKAVQHLREMGVLSNEPKDIGPLLKEITRDITEEEKETIKEWLWNYFGKEVIRTAQQGFPEFYKNLLLERGFEEHGRELRAGSVG